MWIPFLSLLRKSKKLNVALNLNLLAEEKKGVLVMDNDKDLKEKFGLHADDAKQCDTFELEEENRPSHVTLDGKEVVKDDANGHLSRHEKEPEVLESVQEYANRIKSFLGWEQNEEEQEEKEKESGETTSDEAQCDKANEVERSSLGDTTNKENDYELLVEEEKAKTIARSHENESMNEQLNDGKPNSFLQTDPMNDCNEINNSPKSETSELENKAMNPEIVDANSSSGSLDISSVANSKTVAADTVLVQRENESDSGRNVNTTPDVEESKQRDLDNCTSSGIVHEKETNEILEEENKDSKPKNIDIRDQEGNRTGNDSVMSDSKENEIFTEDDVNTHSKQSTCSPVAETKENVSCEKNGCQNDENEDIQSYENLPENYNVKKPYMDEIRRLSIDIVKDLIESARNSVQEMLVNKSDQSTTENENANLVFNGNKILETENTDGKQNITHQFVENEPTQKLQNELNKSKDNINVTKECESYKESATDEESICGFGSFHPKWIQKYATPRIFLLFFSIVGILNGAYYSYIVSVISTLEKRFAFQTKVSGVLLLADEITPLIFGVIVGYFGGRTHRPRMVTLGMLSSAACALVSALPYFFYGSAKNLNIHSVNNVTGPEVCVAEVRMQSCDVDDRPPTTAVVTIFIIASFLKGFANLSYYIIGISFIDDNIKKKNTPLYLAIALALRLLGPLLGFLMSSAFLKLYENPFEDPGFGPDDPRWIGAWWIGFLLQGILLVIFTLPIALFPRVLPGQKRIEKPPSENNKINMKEILAGLVAALKRLGKNPIFILMICNTTMVLFGHFGHSIMLPKYMENQFRLSAADASLFSGAISIFCVMVSTVLGGFLIWKYRPRIKVLLGGMVTSEIILCLGYLVLLIPRCEPMDMLNFGVNDEGLILNSACNRNCDCSTKAFSPFCGPDGKAIYFSPCYAGCKEEMRTEMMPKAQTEFGNCSCISGTNSPEASTATITEGFCPDENCWSKAIVYLVILFTMKTTSSTFTVAHTMILLRSVHPEDKSAALGTFETLICLFGFIPIPVSYGALVDSACLVWEKSCGETGNCWFYDMDKYAYLMHGTPAAFCSLSTMCLIALYFLSPRVRDLYAEEDVEEPINNIKLDTVSESATKL